MIYSWHLKFIYFLCHNQDKYLAFGQEQHPIVLQIGGSDLGNLAKATQLAAPYGYDEINFKLVLLLQTVFWILSFRVGSFVLLMCGSYATAVVVQAQRLLEKGVLVRDLCSIQRLGNGVQLSLIKSEMVCWTQL